MIKLIYLKKYLLRNGGERDYNNLTKVWDHPERRSNLSDSENGWNNHGFTVCLENDLHVVPQAKLEDLKLRTVDPQAVPCIIPIVGLDTLNSTMWLDLQKKLIDCEIEFLMDDLDFSQEMDEDNEYIFLSTEERAKTRLPYLQTTYLINEAVNLSQEWKNGLVKLTTSRTGTKDRIVALSYGNYIATLIQNKLDKNNQATEFDIDAWAMALR